MRTKTFTIIITGAAAVAGLSIAAVAELMRYSPYEDPGALTAGVWLGLGALGIAGTMLAVFGGSIAVRGARGYLQWKRQLTPDERIAAGIAEIAAMGYAHEAWSHHNREASARLTRSVMGAPGDGNQE